MGISIGRSEVGISGGYYESNFWHYYILQLITLAISLYVVFFTIDNYRDYGLSDWIIYSLIFVASLILYPHYGKKIDQNDSKWKSLEDLNEDILTKTNNKLGLEIDLLHLQLEPRKHKIKK